MDPFSVVLLDRLLRDVFDESFFERSLGDVFDPRRSDWCLLDVFNIGSFDWSWLVNFNVLNLIGIRGNNLNDLFLNVFDFIVFVVDRWSGLNDHWDGFHNSDSLLYNRSLDYDGIVVKWVVVIEVLIRDDWRVPRSSNDRLLLYDDEIIVWVLVKEV